MVQLDPYFNFNGNAEEALNFYAETLGGTLQFSMKWADSPMCKEVPESYGQKLMHGTVTLGENGVIMGSDVPPGRYQPAGGGATSISTKTVEEAQRIFTALSTGGTVQMPFGPTFWSDGFGMVQDRFGIKWMVSCPKPQA